MARSLQKENVPRAATHGAPAQHDPSGSYHADRYGRLNRDDRPNRAPSRARQGRASVRASRATLIMLHDVTYNTEAIKQSRFSSQRRDALTN
jgi:hypothetical protein